MSNREKIIILLSPRAPSPTRDIADALGISKALAYDHLKRMEQSGEVASTGTRKTDCVGRAREIWWKLVPL